MAGTRWLQPAIWLQRREPRYLGIATGQLNPILFSKRAILQRTDRFAVKLTICRSFRLTTGQTKNISRYSEIPAQPLELPLIWRVSSLLLAPHCGRRQ